jgi:hypothetical protein
MSVKVDLADLSAALAEVDFGYLMTVGDDQRAHAVAVRPKLDGGCLVLHGLGRRTHANLAARPDVSLVWPPTTEGGYSLIVDARATVSDDGARLTPEHAVLHRPATGEATSACGSDCLPVGHQ